MGDSAAARLGYCPASLGSASFPDRISPIVSEISTYSKPVPLIPNPNPSPCTVSHAALSPLDEQLPVLYLERLDHLRTAIDSSLQQRTMLALLWVDFSWVILSSNMRHIDHHENVSLLLLQPDYRKQNANKVWFVLSSFLLLAGWRRGEEGVGWGALSAR